MTLRYDTYERIETFKTSQEKLDVLHELLAMDGLPEIIRDELRTFIGNILIEDHLKLKYPEPVKEKKPRAPRKKKLIIDVPLEQDGLDAPVVKSSAEPTADQA